MKAIFVAMLCCSLLSGCGGAKGLSVSDIPEFNVGLPEDFKRRVLWNETDIFKYNLEQLAGHVIYEKETPGEFERGTRCLKPDASPTLKVIENGQVYHSKIDRSAMSEGSYLAFAAKLSEDQTADVCIIDVAQVLIPYDGIPIDVLVAEARKPMPTHVTKRLYVQGALLATVSTRYGAKINADASGVVGNVFGAKGNVYKEEQTVSRDVRISLLLIDIDRLAQMEAGRGLEALDVSELIESSFVDASKIASIARLMFPSQ